ncbi:hypothetical protein GCM10011394_15170 [Luteimonas terricola]|uniref:Lipoprotein n=1 Tax=Luteimonas terricola TaxID=645597 RepID=A0ABQ2ECN6_9GAMM|nr:hypothetical protein GCM10011394_15170 [Luteimonas terricola]
MRVTLFCAAMLAGCSVSAAEPERTHHAGDVWAGCVRIAIEGYARQAGSAQEAIDAAKGSCESWRKAITESMLSKGAPPSLPGYSFSRWDDEYGPKWTKAYLDARKEPPVTQGDR